MRILGRNLASRAGELGSMSRAAQVGERVMRILAIHGCNLSSLAGELGSISRTAGEHAP